MSLASFWETSSKVISRKVWLASGIAWSITYRVAPVATVANASTGRSSRYGLTPHARRATASRSPESRPRPDRIPVSVAIGIVNPRPWGIRVSRMRPAAPQDTPLATSFSRSRITGGISRMNV